MSEKAALAVSERSGRPATRQATNDAQVIGLWLHGKSTNTARAYAREVDAFLAFVAVPLPAVMLADVQAYADALAARGLAPATQARALAAVKSLTRFAHTIGYLPFDVAAAERLPRLKETLAERIVSRETVQAMIAGEHDDRRRVFLRLLYFAGVRISEACSLRSRDVIARDGGAAQLTVYGKGDKTRVVLLPATIAGELLALCTSADAPLFAGREGQPISTVQAWRWTKTAAARVGVPALSPHWLRHAHASHALDAGAGIHVVRDTLGHASLATTSRYLHARPDESSALYLAAL
jgi:integrase/recombinase XerD